MLQAETNASVIGEILKIVASSQGPLSAFDVHMEMLENLSIKEEDANFYVSAFLLANSGLININSPSGQPSTFEAGTELEASSSLKANIWDVPEISEEDDE